MENKTIFTICFVGLIIIAMAVYIGNNEYQKAKTNIQKQSFTDGQIYLIQQIQQTGEIPYFANESGQIILKTVKIDDYCKGVNTQ